MLAGCGHAGGDRRRQEPDVPVRVASVARMEVPAGIEGIGNVTPVSSVAIKSRVDGQIMRVVVKDGAEVHRGELLFQLDPRPFQVALAAAQADLARDEAQREKAESQLKRYKDVFAKGYVSADQYADVQAAARSAAATVAADKAAIDNARLNLDFTTLRAPIGGRVGRVLLQQGNLVKASDAAALLTINQIDPIYVDFSAPERYVGNVRDAVHRGGTAVELTTAAATGEPLTRTGQLTFLDNQVDLPTGTIRLRATIGNADRALWPGQFARVRIKLPTGGPVLAVPVSAMCQSPEGPYVYVVSADDRAEQRHVTLDRTEGDYAVISRGLKQGERVVVDGQSRLSPGARIKLVGAAPAKAPM
jgi:membrane fusion protein, multidrug efflux system